MEKTISIDGKMIPFKATASTTRRYRQQFHRDLLIDMQALTKAMSNGETLSGANLEAFENVAYIMAKQADSNIPADPDEWLDQFEMFDIYNVLPELIELWGLSAEPIEESKKKQ